MKKNGFTLVELLAVLVILGIILTITYYSVNSILDNSEESLSNTQISALEESAKLFYIEEGMDLETSTSTEVCVSVKYLLDNGYIEKTKVSDPSSPSTELNGYVSIEKSGNRYIYKYKSGTIPNDCIKPTSE